MRIQNNIMAMNTHRFYTINNNNVSKSAEKLSSGYKVNRAGDDAAGLAISEKMRAEIRGLTMASKNSSDAISMVQTAEGALTEVQSMLQRMKEIAVQAASDSNDDEIDRKALDAEFQQLISEIDDVSKTTTFNDMKLLDGTFQDKVVQIGSRTGNEMDISIDDMSAKALGLINQAAPTNSGVSLTSNTTVTAGTTTQATTITVDFGTSGVIKGSDDTFNSSGVINLTGTGLQGENSVNVTAGMTSADVAKAFEGVKLTYKDATLGEVTFTGGTAADGKITFTADKVGAFGTAPTLTTTLAAHENINVLDQNSASSAIDRVRDSLNDVSSQRAKLGAIQNRLEHKITNLDNTVENVSAAESRIRDVDIAKEMTNFTKNQILSQAATAMLAQANSLPQGVLSLLQ